MEEVPRPQPPLAALDDRDALAGEHEEVLRVDRFLRGGDQLPFLDNGYRSAVRFTEQRENFHHQHQDVRVVNGVQFGDLPRFVSFPYLARATRVNVNTLADAPAEPAGVKIIATQLTNSTTLTWKPNHEPDLAGYEVVWRTTTSPLWQHSLAVGNRTRVTLPLSKDDFIFGVRAVDSKGNRSPGVYPAPLVLKPPGRCPLIEVERVDYIAVPTQDVERARRFYGETLGLPHEKDTPVGAEYRAGQVTVGIVQSAEVGQEFAPNPAGFALRVPDVDAAREALSQAGVELTEVYDTGVCRLAFFSDPDGNRLVLHRRYAS